MDGIFGIDGILGMDGILGICDWYWRCASLMNLLGFLAASIVSFWPSCSFFSSSIVLFISSILNSYSQYGIRYSSETEMCQCRER